MSIRQIVEDLQTFLEKYPDAEVQFYIKGGGVPYKYQGAIMAGGRFIDIEIAE